MKIIGFSGKKGVGKNFVADLVVEVLKEDNEKIHTAIGGLRCCGDECLYVVEQGAFADPIKEFCDKALGLDPKILYGNDDAKNAPTEYKWENMPIWLWDKLGKPKGFVTHRQVMQAIGTELARDIWDLDIWVKAMKRRIDRSNAEYFLISDTRFLNEVDAVHLWGGQVWNIDGPRAVTSGDKHASENQGYSNSRFHAQQYKPILCLTAAELTH